MSSFCLDRDYYIQNVQEVDIKDEDSVTDTDSCSNMSTSYSTTQLSSCNDDVSLETHSYMQPVVVLETLNLPR